MGNYYLVSNKGKKARKSNPEGEDKSIKKRPSTNSDRKRQKKSTGGDEYISDNSD